MATKSVILHCHGNATAPAIISPVQEMQNRKVNLNRLMRRGTSSKNEVFSTSLAVAPHVMSISKKWHRRAWETCTEIPPRKTVRRRSHLKFSKTAES